MPATPEVSPERLVKWMAVYGLALEQATREHPDQYPWSVEGTLRYIPIGTVLGRALIAFTTGSFDKDGHAIKATCKTLGIAHTYKAINAFLRGTDTYEAVKTFLRGTE